MAKQRLQIGECLITKAGRIIHRLPNDMAGPAYEIWAGLGKVYGGVSCKENPGENHSYLEGSMKQARKYDEEEVSDDPDCLGSASLTIEGFCDNAWGRIIYREDLV